jgi:excisionase family DNA binding protein
MTQKTIRTEATLALQEFVDKVLPNHRKYYLTQNENADKLDFLESLNEIYTVDLSDYIRIKGNDFFDNEIHKNKRIIEYLRKQIHDCRISRSTSDEINTEKNNAQEQKVDFNKRVLNLKEAASFLGFSTSYIYKMVHRKAIEFSKPNNKTIYFEREYLENWMLSGKRKTKEEIKQKAQSYCTLSKGKGGEK